jgi:hypothetical protein
MAEPIPNINTPLFPAISLHIIYREFIHQNPQITIFAEMETPFKAYLESRLLTLYPETAYVGMIDEAFAEGKAYQ